MSMILDEMRGGAKPAGAVAAPAGGSLILGEMAGRAPAMPTRKPLTAEPTPTLDEEPSFNTWGTAGAGLPAPKPRDPTKEARHLSLGNQLVQNLADTLDMLPDTVLQAAGIIADVNERQRLTLQGLPKEEIVKAAAAKRASINESSGIVKRAFRSMGLIEEDYKTASEQISQVLSDFIEPAAQGAEAATGGAVKAEDITLALDTAFVGLAGMGARATGKATRTALRNSAVEAARRTLEAQQAAAKLAADELVAQTEQTLGKPTEVRALDRKELEQQRRVEVLARRQKRDDVRAAFAEDGPPRQDPTHAPNTGDLLAAQAEGAIEQRQAGMPPQAGDLRGGVAPEAQSGMAKLAKGKPLSLTDAERAALNLHVLPSVRKGFAPDPQILTAAAVGATGLGLAMMYEPSPDEAALAVGAGALMLGKGRQSLRVKDLLRLPDTTPLRAIRERLPVTLSTIEMLPGDRFEFTYREVEELLKRPEVSEAERGIIREALESKRSTFANPLNGNGMDPLMSRQYGSTPPRTQRYDFGLGPVQDLLRGTKTAADSATDTITAKELMAGVKFATGDFELKKAESSQWADYGLGNIQRVAADEFDYVDVETLSVEPNLRGDRWVINADGHQGLLGYPRAEVPTAEAALARAREEVTRVDEATQTARTRVWQSPIELGANNHFSDPNYFGHTRSFEEGGVRHVVELQSDLAQKARKTLTPEERASYEADLRRVETELQALELESSRSLPVIHADMNGYLRTLGQPPSSPGHRPNGGAIEVAYQTDPTFKALRDEWDRAVDRKSRRDRLEVAAAEKRAELSLDSGAQSISPMLKDWHKRLIREEIADAARARIELEAKARYFETQVGPEQRAGELAILKPQLEAPRSIRFADADTVAKVEGWPERGQNTTGWENTGPRGPAVDAPTRFSPEHQGIYDRYARDVTKFLKQLGGKHITDDKGHGWWEVPLDKPAKGEPPFDRVRLFGAAGLGAGVGALLAQLEPEDRDAALATFLGLGVLRKSRAEAVRSAADAVAKGGEWAFGILSTSVGNISQPLLRGLRQQVRLEMKAGHDRVAALTPFVEGMRERSVRGHAAYPELVNALHNNDFIAIARALGKIGKPELIKSFEAVTKTVREMGVEMRDLGLLKEPRRDYLPRVVTDYKGLLAKLGLEDRTRLEDMILRAERDKLKKSGTGLSELERSGIINTYLAQRPGGTGKPGFLRKRAIAKVTPELEPFYAPPEEALLLYARMGTKAIERARFFGKHAVTDSTTKRLDLGASIGRLVDAEMQGKKVTPDQVDKLKELLAIRFGPGEQATGAFQQAVKNITYMGLLGHATSALVQFGDPIIAGALHGYGNVIKSVMTTLNPKASKIRVSDFGLINHISEEFTNTSMTGKALNKVFKLSGFSFIDTFGKTTILNAAHSKFRQWAATDAGRVKMAREVGDYFGTDLPQLMADLKAGRRTQLVDELLFKELSDAQPISKLEVPAGYLGSPKLRFMYTLKSFMLKQIDIARRKGFQTIAEGLRERDKAKAARGFGNLLNLSLALGVSGAGFTFIRNFLLGRDDELEWSDIPLNAARTFGYNEWAAKQPTLAKALEKQAGIVLPPYQMWTRMLTADPSAVQYIPLVGKALYYHDLEGLGMDKAAEQNAAREKEERRKYLEAIGVSSGKLSKKELEALGVR